MLKQLKSKFIKGQLIFLVLLLAIVIGLTAYIAKPLLCLVQGPVDLTSLRADQLPGAYVRVETDMLYECYAQTVQSKEGRRDEVVRSEYVMLAELQDEDFLLIGLEVLKDNISTADDVVEDTYNYLVDPDNYYWNGAVVTVTGTVLEMDEETQGYFTEVLEWLLGDDYEDYSLPLFVREGSIGGMDKGNLILFGIIDAFLLAALIAMLINMQNGGAPKQIKKYLATRFDDTASPTELDEFYEAVPTEMGMKMDRKWLLYDNGPSGFLLAANDIAWVYTSVTQHRTNGIPTGKSYAVMICSLSEPKKTRKHTVPVRKEQDARDLFDRLVRQYPEAVYGYNEAWNRAYNADPRTFYQEQMRAREEAIRQRMAEQEAAAVAEAAEPAQAPAENA